jgi:hypothetical protein
MKDISKLKVNDVLSETSHYKVIKSSGRKVSVFHLETESEVEIDALYIEACIDSGDEYESEVKVGKEDKFWTQKQIDEITSSGAVVPSNLKSGDLKQKGIRTIWEEIYTPQVFTVCFKKADKTKTQKTFRTELENQREYAVALIEKAKRDKKSMADAYKTALEHIQNNPISDVEEGEERVLRGYKIQFSSRDGKYNCVDMDISENNVRPVNINSISWLIYNNVKYIVE